MVLDDLIGEGNLGLIRASEEFDPAIWHAVQHLCQLLDQASDPTCPDQHFGDDSSSCAHGQFVDQVAAVRAGADS